MTTLRLGSHEIPGIGLRTLVRHAGHSVVIFNVEGHLHAIEDECPHAGAALCTGRLSGRLIQCPAHGLRFDIESGSMPGNPGFRVQVHRLWLQDDAYMLEIHQSPTEDLSQCLATDTPKRSS